MENIILLVEDNPDDEALTLRVIRKQTAQKVIVVRDGTEALDYLFGTGAYEGRNHTASLILLDLKLPKLSGLEVLRRIRDDEETQCIPVVVFSSSTEEQDIMDSYKSGANSYVCKSVDFEKFRHDLEIILTYWFKVSKLPGLGPFAHLRSP